MERKGKRYRKNSDDNEVKGSKSISLGLLSFSFLLLTPQWKIHSSNTTFRFCISCFVSQHFPGVTFSAVQPLLMALCL